jgi:hypothetical protein
MTFPHHTPWDRRIVADGHPDGLQIFGHRAFYATACPGRIYDQVPHLIDLVNQNPAPVPTPTPPAPAEQIAFRQIAPLRFRATQTIPLVDFETDEQVSAISPGGEIVVEYASNIYKASTWYMTRYSYERHRPVAFREEDLYNKAEVLPDVPPAPPAPTPAPPTPPTPTPGPVTPPDGPSDDETARIDQWVTDSFYFQKTWFKAHDKD